MNTTSEEVICRLVVEHRGLWRLHIHGRSGELVDLMDPGAPPIPIRDSVVQQDLIWSEMEDAWLEQVWLEEVGQRITLPRWSRQARSLVERVRQELAGACGQDHSPHVQYTREVVEG